ncbi:uncharacterized protein V1518DRAFT_423718 [Limtongia smithiae]|uniref:uncharacterized protein n=1 Tax=Limtongia smithiae TaxID=1125753 RepID=UPI0034CDBA52
MATATASVAAPAAASPPFIPPLLALPNELLTAVLLHTDIPDLLALSRTCRRLRDVALDTHLHRVRLLIQTPPRLAVFVARRPAESDLRARHILPAMRGLSPRFHAAAATLRLALTKNALARKLAVRPRLDELIQRGVYPVTDARVSPVLALRCKELERAKVRNTLERELSMAWQRFRVGLGSGGYQRCDVKTLVRRFTYRKHEVARRDVAPTRAKVHRLRLFFERLSRSSVIA